MAQVIGKIMAATGTYIKEGAEKTSWTRCGILMNTDKGYRIKMFAYPVVSDGWFMVFEEDNQHQSQGGSAKPAPAPSGGFRKEGTDTDEMPF